MLRAKGCCAATFSKSIKMPFMLRAGTFRLMFQRLLDLSIVIFRCRSTRSYRIARRPLYWLSIIRASSGCVPMSYSREMPPMWYEASTSPTIVVAEREFILEPVAQCTMVKWRVALEQLDVEGVRRSDYRRQELWPCQRQRLNLRFQHRLQSSSCFCYQRPRSPDNDHLPSGAVFQRSL